jgi:hypothetical protein
MSAQKIRGLCLWLFALAATVLAGASKAHGPDGDRPPAAHPVELTAFQQPGLDGPPLTGKDLVKILSRLQEELRSKKVEDRKRAAQAFGMAAGRNYQIVMALDAGLHDRDDEVRIACAQSIGKMGGVASWQDPTSST